MIEKIEYIFPDRYRDIRKIGEGGTAEVFLAHLNGRSRPVVLKLFFDSTAAELIDRELEIAARVSFPGIANVHQSGRTAEGRRFLQMEYCPGPTLERFAGSVSDECLLSILSAVTVSLCVLHQAGYSHNDLKPANLFAPAGFERDDFAINRLHYVKMADFSLARRFRGDETDTPTGTVGYMSPEMILKKEITPASDLFSLGIMAYYLACGRLPFGSPEDDPLEVNAQITEGARPKPIRSGILLSPETTQLIASLLAIEAKDRPASAFDLLEILARAGSPYPFRMAIRPRHLLWGVENADAGRLQRVFGDDSFSPKQMEYIRKSTGYDRAALRLLLEHNFDRGRFARLDGRWGWQSESIEAVEWPDRLTRFSLRYLRNTSISCKRLALALAVIGDADQAESAAGLLYEDGKQALTWWETIPKSRRSALLFSLVRIMNVSTRKILSGRLADVYRDREGGENLAGRLLYDAQDYEAAFEMLIEGAEIDAGTGRFDEALAGLDMAQDAAQSLRSAPMQTDAVLLRAKLLKDQGQLQQAQDAYNRAIGLARKNDLKTVLAPAYKELGDICKALADYNSGISALNQALDLFEELDDKLEVSHTLNNLGNICWVAGKNDRALEYYKRALEIQTVLDSRKDIASSISNIGTLYIIKGEYREGISYLDRSLKIKEELGDKAELARTWNNLGVANQLMGNLKDAVEAYTRSLAFNRHVGDQNEQVVNICNLAESMIMIGKLSQALSHLKEGLSLAEDIDNDFHRSVLNQLTGTLLRRMGYYREAEAKLNEAIQIAERLDNQTPLIAAYISLSRVHIALRDTSLATENIRLAEKSAQAMGDKNALFHLALMHMELTGDMSQRERAEALARELETPRESALLHLTCLETNNRQGATDGSAKYLAEAGQYFSKDSGDIDLSLYEMAAGQYYLLVGSYDRAETHTRSALERAVRLSLLPEQWQAACVLSEIAFETRDFEMSFTHAQQATETLKLIAAKLNDPQKLGRLYNDNRIVGLLGRIKSLQAIVGQQKRGRQKAAPEELT